LAHLSFRDEDATDPGLARRGDEREADPLLGTIDQMLGDPSYNFAERTLKGIYDTIKAVGTSSPGQRQAVANIEESVQRRAERGGRFGGWGRRYDGWSR
jgi:hypothetical protein